MKFKAHYKNENTDKVYDHNFEEQGFAEAYVYAQETTRELVELGGLGWRIVGVYEILYDVEKFSKVIH